MNTAELHDLELQIDSLLDSLTRLKTDNQALRSQVNTNARERSQLQEKNQEAAMKIRRIISQLREELS